MQSQIDMKVLDLRKGFYMFGNKGCLWTNTAHIAKSNDAITLCGTPMLSTNHCRIENVQEIGCKKCLEKYNSL